MKTAKKKRPKLDKYDRRRNAIARKVVSLQKQADKEGVPWFGVEREVERRLAPPKRTLRQDGYTRQWNLDVVAHLKSVQHQRRYNPTIPAIDDHNGVTMYIFLYSHNGGDCWEVRGGPNRKHVEEKREEMIRRDSPDRIVQRFTTVRPIRIAP